MQFRQRTLILQDLTERERRQRSRPLPQAGGYGGIEKAATGRGPGDPGPGTRAADLPPG